MNPRIVAGIPSRIRSHCQPCRPPRPSIASIELESGDPIMFAIGIPSRNAAVALPLACAGNQYVK
jgi:hypothetical protein